LTGYYRRFVRDYGKIAQPLTLLLHKDAFGWNDDANRAFTELKRAMTTTPVLALPDFTQTCVLETDASGRGIGAVLTQGGRPLAYYSRALPPRTLGLSVYEKEMLAIIHAVTHWRPYLVGRHFQIRTDHQSLKFFLEQRVSSPIQQKWVTKLLGYDYEITYKKGKENVAADALSRLPEAALHAVSRPVWDELDEIQRAVRQDPKLAEIITALERGTHSDPGYHLLEGRLLHKGRVVLPADSEWVTKALWEFHDAPVGGHAGVLKTLHRLRQNVYWSGMRKQVQDYIRGCDTCQRQKYDTRAPAGLLQPLQLPSLIWEDLSMDFIEGLPKSKGQSVILVVVDRLSKYSHFIALSHPYTAESVAESFIREIVRLHGIPRSVVSDRDPVFLSRFWKELFRLQGTKLRMSSAYHPQTDGQTEVLNRGVETYLRCFTMGKPKGWVQWLAWAEYCYNTSFHSSSSFTPFEVVYGRPPHTSSGTNPAPHLRPV